VAILILFVAMLATTINDKHGPPIAPADRRLVGLNLAAAMLDVSRSKVHLLCQDDELETVRVGRRLLILVDSLDDYIQRQRAEQS
jgi:excisionase family DNA binding protein